MSSWASLIFCFSVAHSSTCSQYYMRKVYISTCMCGLYIYDMYFLC